MADADALRTDLSACLRLLSGDSEVSSATTAAMHPADSGVESLSAKFLERARHLRQAFAVAALREAAAQPENELDARTLRTQVQELKLQSEH